MQEEQRRSLRELIGKAGDGDVKARAAVEETIVSLDRAGTPDDVAEALEALRTFGPEDLLQSVLTRLQSNDHRGRQQWPIIG